MGMDLIAPAELREIVGRAVRGGVSVAIHAIGDRASRSALDAFEACRDGMARLSLPTRIEHVQVLDEADVPRFAALGVVSSMQPSHCVTDIATAKRYWHTRSRLTYPWRTLLDQGAPLVFGSDAPIEPPDPALGLHAALTRQRVDGGPEGGYVPEQRITLDEALTAYTEGPARLDGRWPWGGRLAVGSRADVVIWDEDLHTLPVRSLATVRPKATVFDGQIVFERLDGQSTSRAAGDAGSAAVGVEGQ
jgi:predicted amidohydrolase YtcJ